jgi:hypothetical protein
MTPSIVGYWMPLLEGRFQAIEGTNRERISEFNVKVLRQNRSGAIYILEGVADPLKECIYLACLLALEKCSTGQCT